jgi:hypothetical protein
LAAATLVSLVDAILHCSLTSPIRYGATPEGARSSNGESLLSGRRYTIVLTRITEAGLERVVVQQDFNTP